MSIEPRAARDLLRDWRVPLLGYGLPTAAIAAYELALIEVVAYLDRSHLIDAMESIRDGLNAGPCEDERAIRTQALQLLGDALARFQPFSAGLWLRAA